MIDLIASFNLGWTDWLLLCICAMLVAMSKTGVAGVYNIVVPLMAIVFGGKASTGILLPILLMGDVFAVGYYNRSAQWKHILRLMPAAFAGVLIGTWVGDGVSEDTFQILLGIVVLIGIALMLFLEMQKGELIPDYWWFSGTMGLLAGFTTMVGNVAGPVVAVYLLSMRLPKNEFIGTSAYFFLLINLIKVPFHVFVWNTISLGSLTLDLLMLPGIALGAFLGFRIVKAISETFYRRFVIVATVASVLLLLL